MYTTQQNRTQIKVKKIILTETKRYNNMYIRPYELNANYEDINNLSASIRNTLTKNVDTEKAIETSISNTASGLLMPSSTVTGEAPIIGGWDERRFKFDLIIEFQIPGSNVTIINYVQGYSSYYGKSHGGYVDENMELYINSLISLRKITDVNTGNVSTVVISNNAMAYDETGYNKTLNNNNALRVSRPDDIVNRITSLKEVDENVNFLSNADTLNDLQLVDKKSATPLGHLSKTLASTVTQTQLNGALGNSSDIYSSITGEMLSLVPEYLDFYKALNSVKPGNNKFFTLSDLKKLDSFLPTPDVLISRDAITKNQPDMDPRNAANTTGSEYETKISLIIQETLSEVLSASILDKIGFTIENSSGTPNARPTMFTSPIDNIGNQTLIINTNKVINEFISKVWNTISVNNKMFIFIDVYAVSTEVVIRVNVDNNGEVAYVYPTFADAKYMPVIMNNYGQDMLAEGYSQLIDTAMETTRSIMQQVDKGTNEQILSSYQRY